MFNLIVYCYDTMSWVKRHIFVWTAVLVSSIFYLSPTKLFSLIHSEHHIIKDHIDRAKPNGSLGVTERSFNGKYFLWQNTLIKYLHCYELYPWLSFRIMTVSGVPYIYCIVDYGDAILCDKVCQRFSPSISVSAII